MHCSFVVLTQNAKHSNLSPLTYAVLVLLLFSPSSCSLQSSNNSTSCLASLLAQVFIAPGPVHTTSLPKVAAEIASSTTESRVCIENAVISSEMALSSAKTAMSPASILASAKSACLRILRGQRGLDEPTTHILDLPAEILLQILEHVGLPLLPDDWGTQVRKGRPASFASDLKPVRLVCRRWNEIVKPYFNARIAPHRGINETAELFYEIVKTCPCPELVRRLRLDWDGSSRLRDVEVLLKPFPALTMVEIVRVSPRDWSEIAGALANFPHLQMLTVQISVLSLPNDGIIAPPANSDTLIGRSTGLLRVKRLSIQHVQRENDLHYFLAWFDRLEHLAVCPLSWQISRDHDVRDLKKGLRSSRRSLRSLELTGLPGKGFPMSREHSLDLRFLDSLESFHFTGFARCGRRDRRYRALRLPSSTKTIVYSRMVRDSSFRDQKNDLIEGERAALRHFTEKRTIAAPGLQRIAIRLSTDDEMDRQLVRRIRGQFGGSELKVEIEFVKGANGFKLS